MGDTPTLFKNVAKVLIRRNVALPYVEPLEETRVSTPERAVRKRGGPRKLG